MWSGGRALPAPSGACVFLVTHVVPPQHTPPHRCTYRSLAQHAHGAARLLSGGLSQQPDGRAAELSARRAVVPAVRSGVPRTKRSMDNEDTRTREGRGRGHVRAAALSGGVEGCCSRCAIDTRAPSEGSAHAAAAVAPAARLKTWKHCVKTRATYTLWWTTQGDTCQHPA